MAEDSLTSRFGMIPTLLYLTMLIVAGASIASNPDLSFALIGLIVFLLFFFHTKLAVYGYAVYLAFEETILQYVPGAFYLFLKYSGDMMLVLLGLAVFAKLATKKYNLDLLRNNPVNMPLLVFVLLAILSVVINQMPPLMAFVGLRQLLRFAVMYYLIMIISSSEWDTETITTLMKVLLVVVVIQACLGYAQAAMGPGSSLNHFLAPGRPYYYEGFRISGGLSWADHKGAYGTMLVRNTYGVFMVFFALMVAGFAHTSAGMKKFYARLLVFIAPCILFSYSRQATYGFFLGMFTIAYIRRNKRLMLLLTAGVLMFALMVSQYRIESPAVTEEATLIEKIASPFQSQYLKWSRKVDRLFVMSEFGPKVLGSEYALIGTGPGSFGSPVGEAFNYNEGYKKYRIPLMGPKYSFAIADTGFFALLGQYGILGLCALIWMFVNLFRYVWRLYQASDDDGFKGFALGILGMIPALLFSNVGYINLDLRQISFYFWFLTALTLTYWGRDTAAKLREYKIVKET